jgi:hypothetical protein
MIFLPDQNKFVTILSKDLCLYMNNIFLYSYVSYVNNNNIFLNLRKVPIQKGCSVLTLSTKNFRVI